jgi:hypothetical protein
LSQRAFFRAARAPPTTEFFHRNKIRALDACVGGGVIYCCVRGRRVNNYVSVLEKTINEEEGSVKPIVKTLVTPHEKLTVCHFVATFFCFKISAALKLCVSISTNRFARKVLCVCILFFYKHRVAVCPF